MKRQIDKTLSKRGRKELRKARMVSAMFLAPSVIGVLVFFILPFFVIIYYSLINNPIQGKFVGLQNFIDLFNNYSFRDRSDKYAEVFCNKRAFGGDHILASRYGTQL